MPTAAGTITIPWDGGTKTFDRDHLTTAYLHYLEAVAVGRTGMSAARHTRLRLAEHEEIPSYTTITLAVAARICHERGIEP
jgi:hypothetical protein